MNRVDRLLGIVLELQAKKWQRAEDLGVTFGVGKRTIYRDIQALSEMGIPLVASPGQGYSLMEGYFLPPLRFTTDEAIALLLGTEFIAGIFDAHMQNAARTAASKITALLSPAHQTEVTHLQASLRLIAVNVLDDLIQPEVLQLLRRAILQCRTLRFAYTARAFADAAHSEREVDPYGLVHYNNRWYLVAYCHLRQDIRHFRLDRMRQVTVLGRTFVRPPHFILQAQDGQERQLRVVVRFQPHVADWVREDRNFFVERYEDTPAGLLVTLRVRVVTDVLQWVLGWGAQAEVIEPPEFRARIQQEARAIWERYNLPETLLT